MIIPLSMEILTGCLGDRDGKTFLLQTPSNFNNLNHVNILFIFKLYFKNSSENV